MGSYNIRCSLTDFTITPGQSVVVIPVISQKGYNPVDIFDRHGTELKAESNFHSTCYASAFWNPIICPIHGAYDEYRLDDVGYSNVRLNLDELNITRLRYFFQSLRDWTFITKAGENKLYDVEFDARELLPKFADGITLDDIPKIEKMWAHLQDVVDEGRLFTRDYSGRPLQVQFMVVWDTAFRNAIKLEHDFDKSYTKGIEQVKRNIEELHAIQRELKYPTEVNTTNVFSNIQAWRNFSDYGSFGIWNDFLQKEVLSHAADLDSLKHKIAPFVEAMLLIHAFDDFNKPIIPKTTTGQDYQNDHGHQLVNFLSKMDKLWSQAYLAEYGESRFGEDGETD